MVRAPNSVLKSLLEVLREPSDAGEWNPGGLHECTYYDPVNISQSSKLPFRVNIEILPSLN